MQHARKLPWETPSDRPASTSPGDALGSIIEIEKALRGIGAKDPARDLSTQKSDFPAYMERMRRAAEEIKAGHQRVQSAELRLNDLAQQAAEEVQAAMARAEAAEIRARDAEARAREADARAQAAEIRAREAETRARAAEDFLVQLHETIVEPLATSLEQPLRS